MNNTTHHRRAFLTACLSAAALLMSPIAHAQAQYPDKNVSFVVPFAPGGSTDILGRMIAQHYFKESGATTIVENTPGAGGNIGAAKVARSKADGHTLEIGAMSTHAMNGSLYTSLSFDPMQDFVPVAMLAQAINVIAVKPSFPAQNFKELIEYVRANPGKVNYSSGGIGTHNHLTLALLAEQAGLEMVHVPYKGGGPAVTALLQGEVDMFAGGASLLLRHAQAGTVRLIAVTESTSSDLVPGVPSASDVVPGFVVTNWYGVFAPKDLDPSLVETINAEINRIVALPEVATRLKTMGMIPLPVKPVELRQMLQQDYELWSKTITSLSIANN
ncbi:MAG TPA: tripartite tricarboxylate transporter substrate binding protein [Burkholderiaceae bacterium]|nr:tripartite tricarboxylate transporter substrate binding protein [Burkholderiaceae bacterium]